MFCTSYNNNYYDNTSQYTGTMHHVINSFNVHTLITYDYSIIIL